MPQIQNPLNIEEHDGKTGAKRVTMWGYNAASDTPYRIQGFGKLVTEPHDYIAMSPDSSRPTVVTYKTGGSGGTTVATLIIAYNGSSNDITSVTRS